MLYLKLILQYIEVNVRLLTIYRADFLNSLVATLGWISLSVIGVTFITDQASTVGGWNRYELYLMMGGYSMMTGIFYFLFPRNFYRFTNLIRDGQLDGLLLKPVDTQFLSTMGQISVAQIGRFLFGMGLIVYSIGHVSTVVSLQNILLSILFLICSVVILYAFWFTLCTLAIWLTDITNIIDVLYEFTGFSRYPSDVFSVLPPILYDLLLPLTVLVMFPVKALLGRLDPLFLALMIAAATASLLFSRAFWKFALRFYTSASS